MNQTPKTSRRQFLKLLLGLGGLGCAAYINRYVAYLRQLETAGRRQYLPMIGHGSPAAASPVPGLTPTANPPTANPPGSTAPAPGTSTPTSTPTSTATRPAATPLPGQARVVHVHAAHATTWNFSSGWYGDYVSQSQVDTMVAEGLQALTGQASLTAAWQALLPGYSAGKGIAIKVNFNNAQCADQDNRIDALIEPVNALLQGLTATGVRPQDIWIYDALRPCPARFRTRCTTAGVRFFDSACAELATFTSPNPDAVVHFQHPGLTDRRIPDLLVDAAYLINLPILKDHGIAGVTLGFKNHFGSLNQITRTGLDDPHLYICPGDSHYQAGYSPLLDLYANPHIQGKTVLTVGDGLFGAYGGMTNDAPPAAWQSFGNQAPNSLFFATDPVAIDCVMLDLLDAEPAYHPQRPGAEDYLKLAGAAGLGVYERGDPWGRGYHKILYQKIEV